MTPREVSSLPRAALRDSDRADLIERRRSPEQLRLAQRGLGHRREVVHRPVADVVQDLESSYRLELLPEVAEHETNQPLGLLAAPIGVVSGGERKSPLAAEVDDIFRGAQRRDDQHRGHEDRSQLGGAVSHESIAAVPRPARRSAAPRVPAIVRRLMRLGKIGGKAQRRIGQSAGERVR